MAKPSDRRPESAIAEDVAGFERQLWEFAKRPNPPKVQEATLRPGAFLHRMYRTWHSLGRGAGGLASHSFRALKDELLKRDPPVRNLQPKLYGTATLSHSDAAHLIDVMLNTWRVTQTKTGSWHATQLRSPSEADTQRGDDSAGALHILADNLLATLFQSEDTLLLEEAVGVPPEVFLAERGRSCDALIIPSKPEPLVHLSPSAAYGGLSSLVSQFYSSALNNQRASSSTPLMIWIYRLPAIRDNAESHHAFHALAIHSAALTNWHFRLSRTPQRWIDHARNLWSIVMNHSAFVVHGLPAAHEYNLSHFTQPGFETVEDDLIDLDQDFFLPQTLPLRFSSHRYVRSDLDYNLTVSRTDGDQSSELQLSYWLFPERPRRPLDETAETTGLPVFDAEASPGADFDLAFLSVYKTASFHLGLTNDPSAAVTLATLVSRGWSVFTIAQLQRAMLAPELVTTNISHI